MKKNTIKLKEEIDMGQVPSAQDYADMRRKRQILDNMPEVRELKRKLNKMRLELDNCEEGSEEEAALIAQIKSINQQIRDYYDRPLNLRSMIGIEESKNMKKSTIKLNEPKLKKIVAESVRKVLREYNEDLYDSIAADARYGDGVYPEQDIYNKQFSEAKSHIEAAANLLNTIDPTDYEDISDVAEEKLTEIYDKLEDIMGDLDTFISGDFVVSQYPKQSVYNA